MGRKANFRLPPVPGESAEFFCWTLSRSREARWAPGRALLLTAPSFAPGPPRVHPRAPLPLPGVGGGLHGVGAARLLLHLLSPQLRGEGDAGGGVSGEVRVAEFSLWSSEPRGSAFCPVSPAGLLLALPAPAEWCTHRGSSAGRSALPGSLPHVFSPEYEGVLGHCRLCPSRFVTAGVFYTSPPSIASTSVPGGISRLCFTCHLLKTKELQLCMVYRHRYIQCVHLCAR